MALSAGAPAYRCQEDMAFGSLRPGSLQVLQIERVPFKILSGPLGTTTLVDPLGTTQLKSVQHKGAMTLRCNRRLSQSPGYGIVHDCTDRRSQKRRTEMTVMTPTTNTEPAKGKDPSSSIPNIVSSRPVQVGVARGHEHTRRSTCRPLLDLVNLPALVNLQKKDIA